MAHLFIFGLGYSARYIAEAARAAGWRVSATGSAGDVRFDEFDGVRTLCEGATHILSSVPPNGDSGVDNVLETYGGLLARSDAWLGYLSSTGVYGDTGGAWVDESADIVGLGGTGRRTARGQADASWLDVGARVFRLPGIYGPGRSVFERIEKGRARRIALPGQVFSRVHVADIASGVMAAMAGDAPPGAYNLGDDLPASQNRVIEHACALAGAEPPPLLSLAEADLSPMARGFYAENRRVANGKAKRVLGWRPAFPTYREGLAHIRETLSRSAAP